MKKAVLKNAIYGLIKTMEIKQLWLRNPQARPCFARALLLLDQGPCE